MKEELEKFIGQAVLVVDQRQNFFGILSKEGEIFFLHTNQGRGQIPVEAVRQVSVIEAGPEVNLSRAVLWLVPN